MPARQVAGLNVLSLVNSHAAAALQYGIDRKYDNRSENVVFYDVGSSSIEARLLPELRALNPANGPSQKASTNSRSSLPEI